MYILALDTETTGLDVNKEEVIEFGYAVYHIENPAPVLMKDSFIYPSKIIDPIITEITGITQDMLEVSGIASVDVFNEFLKDCEKYSIEYIVGHNALEYDVPLLRNNFQRVGLEFPKFKIIDTKFDVKWSVPNKSNKLSYIAADHGVINPFPHRALTDAMTCMILLYKYDIKKILEMVQTPVVEIRADVTYDGKDMAKELQYNWDGDRKIWVKKIREFHLEAEKLKAKFQVLLLRKLE